MNISEKSYKTYRFWLVYIQSLFLMLLSPHAFSSEQFYQQGKLHLPIQVKETAGVDVKHYPVSVVVPLAKGQYQDTSSFRLEDAQGNTVSSQVEVVNRWWSHDNSLRHIKVYFSASVDAFTTDGSGISQFYLTDDGQQVLPSKLKVVENPNQIEVNTGPLRFIVNKKQFNLLDQVWLDKNSDGQFTQVEQMLDQTRDRGGKFFGRLSDDIQLDSHRSDVVVEIEEMGTERVVIKAQANTLFNSTEDHQHGFAVRIYAYADQPFIKVDYQLQNSSKLTKFSWPLYFEAMQIDLPLAVDASTAPEVVVGTDNGFASYPLNKGIELAQTTDNNFVIRGIQDGTALNNGQRSTGFMDVRTGNKGVTGIIRNFWQTWANGLKTDNNNVLSLQLFPQWSSQWIDAESDTDEIGYRLSDTGLYWLQDMQHVYKETLINFHDGHAPKDEINNLAKVFQSYPVATLPSAWYQHTRATLDMGGDIPYGEKNSSEDLRRDVYSPYAFAGKNYGFNWINFGEISPGHRVNSNTTGGWPTSVSKLIVSENPRDYFLAERYGQGELNVRPQWLSGYSHQADFSRLRLTPNPYGGRTWRAFEGHGAPDHAAPLLDNTAPYYTPRDDQHGWFYHVEESYYFTANLWVKDWYEFIAEFRQIQMHTLDPFPDSSTRARGHALSHAMQAYRVTGNEAVLESAGEFLVNTLLQDRDKNTGGMLQGSNKDSAFQAGYLSRAIISYMEEIKTHSPQKWAEAFQMLSGLMNWNYQYNQFAYYSSTVKPETLKSSGTSLTMVDPVAWYGLTTGQKKYLNQLSDYVTQGLNGGNRPYGNFTQWQGSFEGRQYQYILNNEKADQIAPRAVTDLSSSVDGHEITFNWTVPEDAVRSHLLWSTKPINTNPGHDFDPDSTSWFSAEVIGQNVNGLSQSATIFIEAGNVHAVVYSFDAAGNISEASNPKMQEGPRDVSPPTVPEKVSINIKDLSSITLNWPDSIDNVEVQGYKIYRNGIEIAYVTQSEFIDLTAEYGKTYVYTIVAVDVNDNKSSPFEQSVTLIDGTNSSPIVVVPKQLTLTQGETLLIDASASYDINSINGSDPITTPHTKDGYDGIVKYEWDLDNDGIFGQKDGEPEQASFNYDFAGIAGNYTIKVKATDSFGAVSVKSINVLVFDITSQVVRMPIIQDTTLDGYSEGAKSKAHGGTETVRLWSNGVRRVALKSELELPANVKVIQAKLHVYVTHISYPNKPKVSAYAISQAWKEGLGIYSNKVPGATWLKHDAVDQGHSETDNWFTPGGDYDQSSDFGHGANGVIDQVVPEAGKWLSFDVSSVTSQWNNGLANHGLILIGENSGNGIYFASKENTNKDLHPYLEVRYQEVTP